jgi:potassium inwardly-rectifying channel subfamily J
MNINQEQYRPVSINNDERDVSSTNEFRFVKKNGHINVTYTYIGRLKHIHSNIILFIMQAEWWLVVGFVLLGYILSWYIFASLYFLVSIEHGDFLLTEDNITSEDNLTDYFDTETFAEKKMCVQNVHNFLSALLFSIETQHTIGYGSRYITTECMGGILVLTLQSSLGYLLQVIVTQIVFTKLSRPTGEDFHGYCNEGISSGASFGFQ